MSASALITATQLASSSGTSLAAAASPDVQTAILVGCGIVLGAGLLIKLVMPKIPLWLIMLVACVICAGVSFMGLYAGNLPFKSIAGALLVLSILTFLAAKLVKGSRH
ncbi:MAG TPA: hypothetical protein VJ843_03575 [Candidatus Saccharimonadales bacterium]|nr:hypothetical protein [Candidatus Saccharimonadales bacterium]